MSPVEPVVTNEDDPRRGRRQIPWYVQRKDERARKKVMVWSDGPDKTRAALLAMDKLRVEQLAKEVVTVQCVNARTTTGLGTGKTDSGAACVYTVRGRLLRKMSTLEVIPCACVAHRPERLAGSLSI
jgi:hypothetical protein